MTLGEQRDILQTIVQDDPQAFDLAVGKNKNLTFGRFSLLSICYLYGSRNITSRYAKTMRQGKPVELPELSEVYNEFVRVAGRALRLWAGYAHNEVHPLEMLAITGDWYTLRRTFPTYVLGEVEQKRLLDAIRLRYGVTATIKGKQLSLPPKPVAWRVKAMLAAVMCVVLLFVLASTALLSVGIIYRKGVVVGSERALKDAVAGKQYVLSKDISLTSGDEIAAISLDGNGHTIEIDMSETPLFDAFEGTIENCTVLIKGRDVSVREAYACLAKDNRGTWRNVRFSFEGESWQISLEGFEHNAEGRADACPFGGLFVENHGVIEGCTIEGDQRWIGQGVVDGELGAFVGVNHGTLSACTLAGSIVADTMDLGGLVYRNEQSGRIVDCVVAEGCEVKQSTSVALWSPHTGGICAVNYGTVAGANVQGDVVCTKAEVTYGVLGEDESMVSLLRAGGVCAINYGRVEHSLLTGSVSAYGDATVIGRTTDGIYSEAYVGGICGANDVEKEVDANGVEKVTATGVMDGNIVVGKVYGSADYLFMGGLAGLAAGRFERNCFNGVMQYGTDFTAYNLVGLVAGFGRYQPDVIAEHFSDNHVVTLYYGYSMTVPELGYWEQTKAQQYVLEGVTEHSSVDFDSVEVYWYGK
jgi:hypothetical protein